ncbi:MAG: hypothetical protein Q8Q86_03065 [Candidatus Daviesbacteria bacterium]|nr:hypothetical protein [Candidatus Daviesbacteria bacterium]
MPTQRLENRNIRKLTKLGGKSMGITFPVDLLRKLGWRKRQKVQVSLKGKKFIVKDWKK